MARHKLDREKVRTLLRKLIGAPNKDTLIEALSNPIVAEVLALTQVDREYLNDLLYCVAHGAPVATVKKPTRKKVDGVEAGDSPDRVPF